MKKYNDACYDEQFHSLTLHRSTWIFAASSKAMSAILPAGITSTNQLFWFKDIESRYYPCRICERAESRIYLNLEAFWDDAESCLIQALDFPPSKPFGGKDRIVVNRPQLIPFHGTNSTNDEWSRTVFRTYIHERKLEARRMNRVVIKSDLDATYPYLERIRQAAKEAERNAMGDITSEDEDKSRMENDSDMETPYDENLGLEGEFRLQDFSDKKMEPLRPGDVIQYTSPIFVAGDRRGRRQATVLSTDPSRDPMLVLDNGDVLPENIIIKRIQVMEKGTLHPHQGCARRIEKFILKKRALKGDFSVRAGMKRETDRIGRILDKNIQTFQKRAEADGFAPMDLINNYGQRKGRVSTTKPDSQEQQSKVAKKPIFSAAIDVMDSTSESETEGSATKRPAKPPSEPPSASSDSDMDNSFDKKGSSKPTVSTTKYSTHVSRTMEDSSVSRESASTNYRINRLEVLSLQRNPDKPSFFDTKSTRDDDSNSDSGCSLEALHRAREEMASTQQQMEKLDSMNAALEFTNSCILAAKKATPGRSSARLSFTKHNAVKPAATKSDVRSAVSNSAKPTLIKPTVVKPASKKSPEELLVPAPAKPGPTKTGPTQPHRKPIDLSSDDESSDDDLLLRATFVSNCPIPLSGKNVERIGFVQGWPNSDSPTKENHVTDVTKSRMFRAKEGKVDPHRGATEAKKMNTQRKDDDLSFQLESQDSAPRVLHVNETGRKKAPPKLANLEALPSSTTPNDKYFRADNDDLWDSSDTDHRMQTNKRKSCYKRLKKSAEKRTPAKRDSFEFDDWAPRSNPKSRYGRAGKKNPKSRDGRATSTIETTGPPSSLSSLSGGAMDGY